MLGDQDSVVIVATRYRLDGPEIESLWGVRFSIHIQTSHGAFQLPIHGVLGLIPGVEWLGCGDNHPPQSRTKVKE